MGISMQTEFNILKNNVPMTREDIKGLSVGGYSFVINEDLIPFDWDAFSGNESKNGFKFHTGYGFFNDFEISDCYEDDYAELGLTRQDITAEFLASVEAIDEFNVDFYDGEDDHVIGDNKGNSEYTINIISISFLDMDNDKLYHVSNDVIEKFNKGL